MTRTRAFLMRQGFPENDMVVPRQLPAEICQPKKNSHVIRMISVDQTLNLKIK